MIKYRGGGTSFASALNQFIKTFPNPAAEKVPVVLSFMSDGFASYPSSQVNSIAKNAALMKLMQRIWVTSIEGTSPALK